MFIPSRPGTAFLQCWTLGSGESFTTRMPIFGRTLPRTSTSSSTYPMYGIFSPFAAVSWSQLQVFNSFSFCGLRCCSLKKACVTVVTIDPVSRRHDTSAPPILTSTTGHCPTNRDAVLLLLEPTDLPPGAGLSTLEGASFPAALLHSLLLPPVWPVPSFACPQEARSAELCRTLQYDLLYYTVSILVYHLIGIGKVLVYECSCESGGLYR